MQRDVQEQTSSDIPEVLITPFEALRIAEGHPVDCYCSDGSIARVRLPTLQEARRLNTTARASLAQRGDSVPEREPTDGELNRIIQPLRF